LLSGDPSVFSPYFYVKHILPPYALYYYLLMGLSHFMSLEQADKTIVAAVVALTVYGFRYLAVSVGRSASLTSLFVVLLSVSWSLCVGFVSYNLSLALCFWALGLWVRAVDTNDLARRAGFVVLTFIIMFSHPLPLVLLLGFVGCDLLIRIWRDWRNTGRLFSSRPQVLNLATVFLSSLNIAYVAYFARQSPVQSKSPLVKEEASHHATSFMNMLRGSTNLHTAFNQIGAINHGTHVLIEFLLPVSLLLAFFAWWRRRRAGGDTGAYPWFLIAFGAALALFPTPDHVPGYYALAPRLAALVWMLGLLAASLPSLPSARIRVAVATIAILLNGVTLYCLNVAMRPAANERAALTAPPLAKPGETGVLLFDCAAETCGRARSLDYSAQDWAGVNFFLKNNAILLNSPWLELPNIPIGLKENASNAGLPSTLFELEPQFQRAMHHSAEVRQQMLAGASVVIHVKNDDPASSFQAQQILSNDPQRTWNCSMQQHYWEICR
jgi:hypothetical protein